MFELCPGSIDIHLKRINLFSFLLLSMTCIISAIGLCKMGIMFLASFNLSVFFVSRGISSITFFKSLSVVFKDFSMLFEKFLFHLHQSELSGIGLFPHSPIPGVLIIWIVADDVWETEFYMVHPEVIILLNSYWNSLSEAILFHMKFRYDMSYEVPECYIFLSFF